MLHSVSIDGLDSIEEGLDCITMMMYYGYKNRPISAEMWRIFPQLMYICVGSGEGSEEGGAGIAPCRKRL